MWTCKQWYSWYLGWINFVTPVTGGSVEVVVVLWSVAAVGDVVIWVVLWSL